MKYYNLHEWVNYYTPKEIVKTDSFVEEVFKARVVYQSVNYRNTQVYSDGKQLLISYDDLQKRHETFWSGTQGDS